MNSLLNNIRLRNKMLLVYFLCVFAPIILTNAIFFSIITGNVRDRRMEEIARAVEQIKNDFRLQVDEAVGLSSYLYADYNTNLILEKQFVHTEDYVEAYDTYLRPMLNGNALLSSSLQGVTIYADNPTLLNSGNIGILTDRVREEGWYITGMRGTPSQPVFLRSETADGRFQSFSLIRRMDYFSDRMFREKLVKIDFKTIDINELFSNLNMQGQMYLLNPDGEIEFTTNQNMDWRANDKTLYDNINSNDTVEFVSVFRGVSYLDGWRVVGTVDEEEIIGEGWNSRYFVLWSAGAMMVIPTIIILYVTRTINLRIVKILKHMKKVKSQSFETILHGETRDEIGQLTTEFNSMVLQVKSLIDDVYIAEIQKKSLELERRKAQFNALQSQINPHFLFNALETIRMRSLLKEENETARIIHSMANIFRSSLTWNKDCVSVREELEFIHCFLDIQKYRFEDKLEYRLEVGPDAYDRMLPKMTFLPFVENACIHGIEPLKDGGSVDIGISVLKDELVFSIHDNGIGMEEGVVTRLYGYMEHDEIIGDRIGIQNVLYRLRMIYGDRVRFTVQSEPERGTSIELAFPAEPGNVP